LFPSFPFALFAPRSKKGGASFALETNFATVMLLRPLVACLVLATAVAAELAWVKAPPTVGITRADAGAVALSPTQALLFGGQTIPGALRNTKLYLFDLLKGTAEEVPTTGSPPAARNSIAVGLVSGEFVVAGGTGTARYDDVFAFNVSSSVWRSIPDILSEPKYRTAFSSSANNAVLLVWGGQNAAQAETNTLDVVSAHLIPSIPSRRQAISQVADAPQRSCMPHDQVPKIDSCCSAGTRRQPTTPT
jgi:hypothetical protein